MGQPLSPVRRYGSARAANGSAGLADGGDEDHPVSGQPVCNAVPICSGVTPRHQENPMSPMKLLESGIPLSLLLDLVCGPQSADLIAHEAAEASAVA